MNQGGRFSLLVRASCSSPSHKSCQFVVQHPDSVSSLGHPTLGARMDLSSHGSGVPTRLYLHITHVWADVCWPRREQRLASLPTSCSLHSQRSGSREHQEGAFPSILIQGRASPSALGMEMPMGVILGHKKNYADPA